MPGTYISAPKRAFPVTLSMPSGRSGREPTILNCRGDLVVAPSCGISGLLLWRSWRRLLPRLSHMVTQLAASTRDHAPKLCPGAKFRLRPNYTKPDGPRSDLNASEAAGNDARCPRRRQGIRCGGPDPAWAHSSDAWTRHQVMPGRLYFPNSLLQLISSPSLR